MTVTHRIPGVIVSLALLLGPLAWRCAAKEPSADRQAQDILKAAGIKAGLIVHLGCGNGRLTTALGRAKPGPFVVRGPQLSPAAAAGPGARLENSVDHVSAREHRFAENL